MVIINNYRAAGARQTERDLRSTRIGRAIHLLRLQPRDHTQQLMISITTTTTTTTIIILSKMMIILGPSSSASGGILRGTSQTNTLALTQRRPSPKTG